VPDQSRSLAEGAVTVWAKGSKKKKGWNQLHIEALAKHLGVSVDERFDQLGEDFQEALFYGMGETKIEVPWEKEGQIVPWKKEFEGVCRQVERHYRESESDAVKRSMGRFITSRECRACTGQRLRPEYLAVRLSADSGEMGIQDFCGSSIKEVGDYLAGLSLPEERVTLDRASGTLSGGEFQRVRLATQLGAGLAGVLYVLDEPSIGLHPLDNERLIAALLRLRDAGNTVVVVEHDEAMVRAADQVIEIGPAAGLHGGELVCQGTPEEVAKLESATGRWLRRTVKKPHSKRRKSTGELKIIDPRENNLKGDEVIIPLGLLVGVSGPSGSGKSTLIDQILRRSLARFFHRAKVEPGEHERIEGMELICEKCQGGGALKIDMHFLPDVWIACEACRGDRYNRETLEVRYRGKNVADVLEMTVEEARDFFGAVPKLSAIMNALFDVGLAYVKLGQAANTLSGGEAQRVKLACELSKSSLGHTLYLLDEPTTGLHYQDVQVLLEVLFRLRDAGHSLVVVEHNLDVIAACDHLIDLGPTGGEAGGYVVAQGTPGALMKVQESATGRALKMIGSQEGS